MRIHNQHTLGEYSLNKAKKASIPLYHPILVILFAVVMITALLWFAKSYGRFEDRFIGEKQAEVFQTYQKGERALFYLDQAAKLSAYDTIHTLAQKGGSNKESPCGTYQGYALWNNKTEECYPAEDLPVVFIELFGPLLSQYLGLYPEADFSLSDGTFNYLDNEIVGVAGNDLLFLTGSPSYAGSLDIFPYANPDTVSFSNDWGNSRSGGKRTHEGTDVMPENPAEPILAVRPGTVVKAWCNPYGGNRMLIRDVDDPNIEYYYAHMGTYAQNWQAGDIVATGQVLGETGDNIGCYNDCTSNDACRLSCPVVDGIHLCGLPGKTIPHLHFGIYVNKEAMNPYDSLQAVIQKEPEQNPKGGGGSYTVKPSFRIATHYDLVGTYQTLASHARNLIQNCANAADLDECITLSLPSLSQQEFSWSLGYCEPRTEEEKACLKDPYTVPFFDAEGDFTNCGRCPQKTPQICQDYATVDYCVRDPCTYDCLWDGTLCREKTEDEKTKGAEQNENSRAFCVRSKQGFMTQEDYPKSFALYPVQYRFALTFVAQPPPPVEDVTVFPFPGSEGSLVVKFKKSPWEKIRSYKVYYATTDFKDQPIANHVIQDPQDSEKTIPSLELSATDYRMFSSMSFDSCTLKRTSPLGQIACLFDGNKLVQTNQLYFLETTQEFFYVLTGLEEQNYFVAVTAIGENGAEINNQDEGQRFIRTQGELPSAQPTDTLSPGLTTFQLEPLTIQTVNDPLHFSWTEVLGNLVPTYPFQNDLDGYILYYQCDELGQNPRSYLLGTTSPVYLERSFFPACHPPETTSVYAVAIVAQDDATNVLPVELGKALGLGISALTITDEGATYSFMLSTPSFIPEEPIVPDEGGSEQ
ncbi:M23 family metallopeptidase [Candidatus Woesearchaeota archaeon]|nr:M23 family metallopeptidase [Candidatus Woesearchaeota archaeon]